VVDTDDVAASIEAALSALITQLDRPERGPNLARASTRVADAIAAARRKPMAPGSRARIKQLHTLALAMLADRRTVLGTELVRVREARALLRSRPRSNSSAHAGGDCDVAG